MPSPATSNRTLWLNASDTDRLWTDGATMSVHPSDGAAVTTWDDEADATDSAAFIETSGQEPLYRATGMNSLGALDFDGVDNYMRLRNDADSANKAISTYFTASAWTIFIAFHAQGAGGTNASAHNNDPLLHNISDVCIGLYVERIGGIDQVTLRHSDFVTAVELSKTISLNTNHIVMARRGGGSLFISVDNGAETSQVHGNTGSLTQGMRIGGNSSGPRFFNGMIGEILFYNAALSGTNFSDTYQYLIDKWQGAGGGGAAFPALTVAI